MSATSHALSIHRSAALVSIVGTVLVCVPSCGARTGLQPDKAPPSLLDGSFVDGADEGAVSAGTCPAASIEQENDENAEAGVACMAGEQLLLCDVASTGTHGFPNYCVTSSESCSAADNPSCEAQCNPGEFGLLCSDQTSPNVSGCRILYPTDAGLTSGFAFCCPCIGS